MSNPHPNLRFKMLKDSNSILARYIIKRHPNGFLSATVTGERGYGKSMYCYKTMAEIYHRLDGCTEEEAYKKALDHMIFSTDQFITLIDKSIETKEVIPVLTLDDSSVYFCSYNFFTDMKRVIQLHAMFDLIRTSVTGLLLNCPNRKMLLSFMRSYDDF